MLTFAAAISVPPLLSLDIPGTPRPQGSVKAMVNKNTGQAFVKYHDVTIEHRNLLIHQIGAAFEGAPLDVAVALLVTFTFARPLSHFGTGKNAGLVKRSSPVEMTQAPDVDKLLRLVCDALEISRVLLNDSQVVSAVAHKAWGPISGTQIQIYPFPQVVT